MFPDVRFVPGQRWISIPEPELGLGEVRDVGVRRITMWFEGTGETREYACAGDVPLRRAAFHTGDTIATRSRPSLVVEGVHERDGLLYYQVGDGSEIAESELSPRLGFNTPARRLFAAEFDPSAMFEHRVAALMYQSSSRRSEVRGLVGARIDLLPHQLGIAADVANRLLPRVLLADEVGLGKTIEACLIVHRLLLTGRARRVMILVPETLVHQWFLELLRRFNLWFHIFTEARCAAIEEENPGTNPFAADQLILCELTLFTGDPRRLDQAIDAGWDVVVVDEAHHLGWSPEAGTAGYAAVERLARAVPGLLLLTATPEQLGRSGHFARLRLLDPDRFADLDRFTEESARYKAIARLAERLRSAAPLTTTEQEELAQVLDVPATTIQAAASGADVAARQTLFERLLDERGTSRVMFRNTRAAIGGFPTRVAALYPLEAHGSRDYAAIADELRANDAAAGRAATRSLAHDPRIAWLVGLLQKLAPAKVLLICRTPQLVRAIDAALRQQTTIAAAMFHEEMTLIQRDRGAASFADPEGVRVLLASEIGSEGRNFQFAHHLVLFDLPLDPGLLEQRLGRLDRIGQRADIHVHVPYVRGTHQEVLARWYHDGLNAFEQQLPGAPELLERFAAQLRQLMADAGRDRHAVEYALAALIADTRRARAEVAARLEEGRDRLLEWSSARPALSGRIIEQIRHEDADRTLDAFMLLVFDLFVIQVEEVAPRSWRLGSAGVLVDEFPGLKAEGMTVTRDRARALDREDLQFLTWDHPLATGALDLLLGSEKGNCAFAHWVDPDTAAVHLDAVYVLECLAPPALHADRFLPPTPLRTVVDHRGGESEPPPLAAFDAAPHPALARTLVGRSDMRDRRLPRMIEQTRSMAERQAAERRREAASQMEATLRQEIGRLRDLQRLNGLVRDEEIAALEQQQQALGAAIAAARVRLDAVRLVYRGPRR